MKYIIAITMCLGVSYAAKAQNQVASTVAASIECPYSLAEQNNIDNYLSSFWHDRISNVTVTKQEVKMNISINDEFGSGDYNKTLPKGCRLIIEQR
jgi:hypothetical protein